MIWFVPLAALSGWELCREDSEVIKAVSVLTLLNLITLWSYTVFRIARIAKYSCNTHRNHAVLLFGDENILSKWGFLFSEYKSCCAYFLIPRFVYLLLKSLLVGIPQDAPVITVVAVFVLDLAYFTLTIMFRPYMNPTINILAISVISITLFNSTLLLLFSNIFGLPVGNSS
jgi:hypothetical protein